MSHDDYNEWAAERLLSDDEELAWRRDRAALLEQPDERPSTEAMVAHFAAERAEVEAATADVRPHRWDGWRSVS